MAESLKNDDKSIRSYILNDVLEKVPIDKSFKNLCKVIGNDAIAFYDFQFWYYRFLSGNQDLDFDRSSEPEPLQFSDLPVDAVGLIVNKLEIVERLMLRRVSKPLREFIEKQVFDCDSIDVNFANDIIRVSYGSGEILYAKNDEAVNMSKALAYCREPLFIYGDDYESQVRDDLACVLKNPKLQLYYFRFAFFGGELYDESEAGVLPAFITKFEYTLKSLKHQIAAQQLHFGPDHPDKVLAILPCLKPGYLQRITIDHDYGSFDWKSDENTRKVEQIMQLDQWKQANYLHLHDSLDSFPDEVFVQFKRYRIRTLTLNRSQLDRIKTNFATSPVFEYCYISIKDPSDEWNFIDFIGVPGPITKDYLSVRHYMIPNTDKLLVFKENEYEDIVIEKKTRVAQ